MERAITFLEKGRNEGLLSIEEIIDKNKLKKRDIMELGSMLAIYGAEASFLNKVLTNLVNLETDKDLKILKTIQKEAVLSLQAGDNLMNLVILLNSYVDIGIEEAMKKYCEE